MKPRITQLKNGDAILVNNALERQVINQSQLAYAEGLEPKEKQDLTTKGYVDNAMSEGSKLGTPSDGTYTDGLLDFTPETKTADAVDDINELFTDLAPADATSLEGIVLTHNFTMYTGKIADDSSHINYKSGSGAGTQVAYLVKANSATMSLPTVASQVNKGDQGKITLYLNDILADTFDLANKFDITKALDTAGQTYTKNNGGTAATYNSAKGMITILSVCKHNNFRKWQRCNFQINLSGLRKGYNKIQVKHEGIAVQSSAILEVYYDDASTTVPTIANLNLAAGAPVNPTYLSGVQFYNVQDNFQMSCSVLNPFNNAYLDTPATFSGNTSNSGSLVALGDAAISGVSAIPKVGENMLVTNKLLANDKVNSITNDYKVAVTPKSPYGTGTVATSASQGIHAMTYTNDVNGASDDKNEYFTDEYYRLPLNFDFTSKTASYVSLWDSKQLLTNGNAQCYFNASPVPALVYPSKNFQSNVLPTTNTANYSTFTGSQQYARCFISTSGRTSATINLFGVASGISTLGAGSINVEVKLPTQTGWLDCAKAFSSSAGVGSDGLGCLNGSISYSGGNAAINVTFGGKSTVDSNNRIYVRVTLRDNTKNVTKLTVTNF